MREKQSNAGPSASMAPVGTPRLSRFTYADISARSAELRVILAERRVRFHRDSALGKLLRDAERLAKDWEDGRRDQGIRQLVNSAHANRIAEAILEVRSDPDAQQCLLRIAGNDVDLSRRGQSQGKDHLWELDLLLTLRRRGMACELVDPPDIVATLAGASFPIACKKVYSEKGVEAQMRRGVKQLEGQAGGLVAFNIDDLVPDDHLLTGRSQEAVSNFLFDFNQAFIERHRFMLQRYVLAGRCDGILVSTSVVADIETLAPRFNLVSESTLWTVEGAGDGARARFAELRNIL